MAKKKAAKKTPKKKSPQRRQKPKIVSIVACDAVIHQMPDGKPSLIGVFDRIQVNDPAKPFRTFPVFTKFLGGKGTFRIGMAIKTPKGRMFRFGEEQIDFVDPNAIYRGVTNITKLDVSQSGVYLIYVTVDGEKFGNPCPIVIVHVDQDEKGDSE